MALLKQQLAALGMEFIGELLQRPDIDEFSDVQTVVSETEAISLARDLGIITKLQTMRLLQSQAIVAHFASIQNDATSNEDEVMTREEAISCLRVCVQWVLGHEQIAVAEDFKRFREKLESATLAADAPELDMLRSSPYFLSEPQSAFCCLFLKRPKGASRTRSAECAADCSRILGPVKSP
ncbi:MAG: hypothetical protein JOY71_17730 [Acetobacteraceae bacterium]|nr:hypothetical protein [Acetobacteraceae bacterium]